MNLMISIMSWLRLRRLSRGFMVMKIKDVIECLKNEGLGFVGIVVRGIVFYLVMMIKQ